MTITRWIDNIKKKEDNEEERRLFYVAITRAEHKLYLSYASIRTIFGSKQVNYPSEFLGDIPPHLTIFENENQNENFSENDAIVYL